MIDSSTVRYAVYDTPVGNVTILATGRKISSLMFGSFDPRYAINEENVALYDAIVQINQFCYGQRKTFDLKLRYEANEEQIAVYHYCNDIPYGETRSIEEIRKATSLSINNIINILLKTPLPLFIPTHRIVNEHGDPVAFMGQDLIEVGKKLLAIEQGVGRKVYNEGSYKELE